MVKKITYIFTICLWAALNLSVFPLAPRSHPVSSINVENEVEKFSELVMDMSKNSVYPDTSSGNNRMQEQLRREFIPQLTEILASWNLKIAQEDSGAFFPLKFNSLQAKARLDYMDNFQNKITFQVVDKKGEIYSVVYSPQNTKRDPFLDTPQMMANYISVFDKDNRKISLRKFLYCQRDNLPFEAMIPELRGDTKPVLTVPAFIVSRIGGEDGVSLEAINRIRILLRKAERLEKEGKISPGFRIHIITGDYDENPYLESLIKKGSLKICNIPSADPDKNIESNQKLFYAMFGINSEAEKEEFVREIQERSDKVSVFEEEIKSLDRNIKKVISRDNLNNKKTILDSLYSDRSKIEQELVKLKKILNEKKIYYQKKGKKNKKAALKSLNKQAAKIHQTMNEYLAENSDIEIAILENASLPFFQAKLFKAAFKIIKDNNFSTVVINHDWPDDRTEIYDFDSVLEEIQDVFLKEFFSPLPPCQLCIN